MEALLIKATNDTPKIIFDGENDIFEISGKSLPENAIEFYEPVFNWLEIYTQNPKPVTVFNFQFEYFNTASSKQIIQILTFIGILSKKASVSVNWHYRDIDEDMLAIGQEYSSLVKLPFEFAEYNERLDFV